MHKLVSKPETVARVSATSLIGLVLVFGAPAVPFTLPHSLWLPGAAMAQDRSSVPMKRYENPRWKFALDIPVGWHAYPPGPALKPDEFASPQEVMRFFPSSASDAPLAVVYRSPHDPSVSPAASVPQTQALLAKSGFSNFVTGQTKVGTRTVMTLDFEKLHPGGETWRGRAYFIVDGTLMYVLGFGATERDAAPGLYDRMAKSFVFDASAI